MITLRVIYMYIMLKYMYLQLYVCVYACVYSVLQVYVCGINLHWNLLLNDIMSVMNWKHYKSSNCCLFCLSES